VPPADKPAVQQAGDGSITLNADQAILHGALKAETKGGRRNVGYWLNPKDWVSWEILLDKPGPAAVEVRAVAKNTKSWAPLNIASITLTKAT
jgi:hypothetical protein